MKAIVLAVLVLVGCAAAGDDLTPVVGPSAGGELSSQIPEPPAEPAPIAFAPEPAFQDMAERVAARWAAATGVDVRVGPGIPIAVASVEARQGHKAAAARAPDGTWSIGMAPGLTSWTAEVLLLHEVGHVLGCLDHTSTGLMRERTELGASIDAAALECVCAALACTVFAPEIM